MKNFALTHFLEPLMDDESFFTKRMFGGLAVYFNDLMVFVLCEDPGNRTWKKGKCDYDIWNGVLICTSRIHHPALKTTYPSLIQHPVIGKWLYLQMSHSDFERDFQILVEDVLANSENIGIVPKKQ